MLTSAPIEAIVSFVVDPSYCTLTSTYTGSDSNIITYAADTQTVTIYNNSDLSLAGPLAPPYEQYIRVDILGSVDTESDTSSFILTVQNPCPHLATISTPSDYSVDYPVYSAALVIDYTLGFSVGSSPELENLCGQIAYTVSSGTSAEILDSGAPDYSLTVYSSDIAGMVG